MMNVVSRNPFDLLGESEESETVVNEKEPLAKEKPVVTQKKVDRSRASPKEARIRHEYPQRGGHRPSTSNRNNEDTRSGGPRDRNVGPRLSGRREEGSGGGGGGDYNSIRPSRGARPNERGRGRGGRRGGREFDRHSGMGKHDSEKKVKQGWGDKTNSWENNGATESEPNWNSEPNDNANNNVSWGDNTNDTSTGNWGDNNATNTTEEKNGWNAEEKSATNDGWNTTEETNSNWEQPTEPISSWVEIKDEEKNDDTAAGDSAPVPEPEPEEVVKTFDEYLAEKAQKNLDISLPEARKPNEGVDDSQWKDTVPFERAEEEDPLYAGKEQSYRLKNKKSKSKTFVEIAQTFDKSGGASPRGRGRGRGRGGGRGGRDDGRDGRGSYRDNNYDDNRDNRRRGGGGRSVVNLDDTRAFPSLGAS